MGIVNGYVKFYFPGIISVKKIFLRTGNAMMGQNDLYLIIRTASVMSDNYDNILTKDAGIKGAALCGQPPDLHIFEFKP